MRITQTKVVVVVACFIVIPFLLLSIARFAHIRAFCTPVTVITVVDNNFTMEEAQTLANKHLPLAEVRRIEENHYEAFAADEFLILKQGTEENIEYGRFCE